MSMSEIQTFSVGFISENQSGIKSDAGKKSLLTATGTAIIRGAFFPRKGGMFFYHIVVSVNHVKTIFFVKPGQKPEYVAVYFLNLFHAPVLPELIPIPQFNVGKAPPVVIFQCGKIEMLVF